VHISQRPHTGDLARSCTIISRRARKKPTRSKESVYASLRTRFAVVTGAASGIGKEIARSFRW